MKTYFYGKGNQMNKSNKQTLERGITLISLIITIIIMVILAALILRAVTGDNDLIGATQEASENYKVAQYKEELIAEAMGVIQESMIKGEDVTKEKIAEAIKKDIDWVKDVKVNEDETISSPDIIVISKEGYIFQLVYDDVYGSLKVEYLGKDPSGGGGSGEGSIDEALKYIPNVTGRYDKLNTKIVGTASVAKGSIKKLEIIFKRSSLSPDEGSDLSNISKTITEGGIYEIKATTDRGITRSAYVRVNSLSR